MEETQKIRYRVNSENFVTRQMGDEMVMVPLSDKVADMTSVLTLNEVGADILHILETPATIEEVVEKMVALYDAGREQIDADVREFIHQAMKRGVIEVD